MAKEEKCREFMCYLLYELSQGKIHLSPKELKSVNEDMPLPQEVIDILDSDEYKYYYKKFEECVEYIDDIKNPTGINKYCRNYALSPQVGKLVYKKIKIKEKDDFTGEEVEKEIDVIDHYEPIDEDEYVIIICDNASNLTLESGMNIMQTINKMSKYFVTLRNQLNLIPVLIQHQSQEQEGLENIKYNKLKPSAAGLAECRTTIRDVNTAIGIYSPFKHDIQEYGGYPITKLKNYSRFMEIMEDRDGAGSNICPLFFDGAVSIFRELPEAHETVKLQQIYNRISTYEASPMSVVLLALSLFNKSNIWGKLSNLIKKNG